MMKDERTNGRTNNAMTTPECGATTQIQRDHPMWWIDKKNSLTILWSVHQGKQQLTVKTQKRT